MPNLRWGILAAGNIAGAFTRDLIANGMSVAAVGSRSLSKARAFAADHGIAVAHGSYEALMEDADVDVIYIATPHPFHCSAAALAIRSGKHVLIEKPVTLNAAEARYLEELALDYDVVVMEAMWTRFLPHMRRIRDLVANGTIGEIRSIVATNAQVLPSDPEHRLNNLALGGGALLDLGVYPVSFAMDLLGKPDTVIATGRLRPTGADAEVSVMFRYNGGASALLSASSDASGPNTAFIGGSNGHIVIDGDWYTPTTFAVFDSEGCCWERYFGGEIIGRGMHFQALELQSLEIGRAHV